MPGADWSARHSRSEGLVEAPPQHPERAEQAGEPFLDPYALEDPAEFFAVASESFFESPGHLRRVLPDLYEQLALFYRQRPAG